MAPLAEGWLDLPANAPAHVLLTRWHKVGILVTPDFSLHANFSEVLLRCQFAWHQQVASMVAHRTDFRGLYWADVVTTRRKLYPVPSRHCFVLDFLVVPLLQTCLTIGLLMVSIPFNGVVPMIPCITGTGNALPFITFG